METLNTKVLAITLLFFSLSVFASEPPHKQKSLIKVTKKQLQPCVDLLYKTYCQASGGNTQEAMIQMVAVKRNFMGNIIKNPSKASDYLTEEAEACKIIALSLNDPGFYPYYVCVLMLIDYRKVLDMVNSLSLTTSVKDSYENQIWVLNSFLDKVNKEHGKFMRNLFNLEFHKKQ